MAKRTRCPARKPRVTGSIPGEDIYSHAEFFTSFPCLQLSEALANEIEQDHSPIVIVVLDPRYDY